MLGTQSACHSLSVSQGENFCHDPLMAAINRLLHGHHGLRCLIVILQNGLSQQSLERLAEYFQMALLGHQFSLMVQRFAFAMDRTGQF